MRATSSLRTTIVAAAYRPATLRPAPAPAEGRPRGEAAHGDNRTGQAGAEADAAAGAGNDDTLELVTPLFNTPVKPGKTDTVSRRHKKSFRALDLNEDQGDIPNPDEIRALVTLRPAPPSKRRPTKRESPMIKLKMG